MKHSLVSIIIPCYNQAQFLNDCLNSVLSQCYVYWEAIIVNDGSIDNTEDVAKDLCKLDSRVKYIRKENGGLSNARNIGILSSNGDFILPLDADDLIHATYLSRAIEAFEVNKNLKLVYGKAEKFGVVKEVWQLPQYSYKQLLLRNMIYCSAVYKRVDYDKVGGYDENMKKGLEDWEFWIRLLNCDSEVHWINDVMFYYRIKEVSMVTQFHGEMWESIRSYVYFKHNKKYTSIFGNPFTLISQNMNLKSMYKDSIDYKLGNGILQPIRTFNNRLGYLLKQKSSNSNS